MMKKNRIVYSAAAAVMAASALGGCVKTKEGTNDGLLDAKNPITITIWHYYNGVQQTSFDEMVKSFNETVGMEKGIIVEAISKSSINDLADSVMAAVNKDAGADAPPDIFATYSETAYKLDKMGVLADLNKYFSPDAAAEYVPEYLSEGAFSEGTLKIFPTAKSTEVMMLNKTDWDKFSQAEGVTLENLKTIEGLTAAAEKYFKYTDALTPDVPYDGKAFFGRDSVANYMYIGGKQLGCEYVTINEDGTASMNIDKEAVRKLWENYYVPFVKGYFTAQSRYRSDDAKTGAIISLVCSTTGAAYFPVEVTIGDDFTYPIESLVTEVPVFEGAEPYLVQQGAGMSVIKTDEPSEYASLLFLQWFTEEERNISFSIGSGYMPVKKSANDFGKISAANSTLEKPMGESMLKTMETAINEVNTRKLYTAAPFSKLAETRDYIGNTMQDSAAADYNAAWERIRAGEDMETVLNEYTSAAAFDAWYDSFSAGLESVIAG